MSHYIAPQWIELRQEKGPQGMSILEVVMHHAQKPTSGPNLLEQLPLF